MKSVLLSIAAAWNVPQPVVQTPATAPVMQVAQSGHPLGYEPQNQAVNGAQVVYEPARPASSVEVPVAAAYAVLAAGVALGYTLGSRRTVVAAAIEAEDMYWGEGTEYEGNYPPSRVLGIGRNVPSKIYGPLSGIAFAVGAYCIAQSNLLNILSGSTVNGWYVAGSLLVPYSWGLHVACWIQKQNEDAGTFGK